MRLFRMKRLIHERMRYATYTITVKIWEEKGAAQPIDTLVQKVRSYVDTTGPSPVRMKQLRPL